MSTAIAESRRSEGLHHDSHATFHRSYEYQLKHTVEELMHELSGGVADTEAQKSKFISLFQSSVDPSLEIVWIISALSFHDLSSNKNNLSDRISAIESEFQTIISFSTSCDGTRVIILLSMVIFEVNSVVTDMRKSVFTPKILNRLVDRVESLLDRVIGFIGLCCKLSNFENDTVCSVTTFVNLVRIYMKDKFYWSFDEMECIKLFFPFVSEDTLGILEERLFDVGYLAGVVITGAFLMRLCLKYCYGIQGPQLVKYIGAWAVCLLNSCQSYTFFEIIMRMLLEPTLPETHLMMCGGDEISLRKIMYDAVVIPEYSFLKSESAVGWSDIFPVLRLLVAHKATGFYRENDDHAKVISYAKSFSSSTIPSQLTRVVQGRLNIQTKAIKPDGLSTASYLGWLLDLEKSGLGVLEHESLKAMALSLSKAGRGPDSIVAKSGSHDSDMFFVDRGGEEDEDHGEDDDVAESVGAALIKASHALGGENCSRKRRKVGAHRPRYTSHGVYNPGRETRNFHNSSGGSSGSEVDDPGSDSSP